jgi:hypothetical protein
MLTDADCERRRVLADGHHLCTSGWEQRAFGRGSVLGSPGVCWSVLEQQLEDQQATE